MVQDARADAYAIVEAEGLAYARERNDSGDDLPYWFEGAAYVFTENQIDRLETVTAELHDLAMQATRAMSRNPEILSRIGVPEYAWSAVRESVDRDWSLYGRFDLIWDGESHPKMLEYNADTPAALVEGAVTQWNWLEAVKPDKDQWNMLHERLVQTWRQHLSPGDLVHLAAGADEPLEDWNTLAYVADTIREAGGVPVTLSMEEIGLAAGSGHFVDLQQRQIDCCFAMYPWEWMLAEEFGRAAIASRVQWVEPVHKVLTGSKALLAVLWEMFEGHPNLLPTYWTPEPLGGSYVVKPIFGWEGAGVTVVLGNEVAATSPARHTEGQVAVYQQYREILPIDGNLPVLGTWVIGGHAAGLGIRETDAGRLITDIQARFVPHFIDAPRSSTDQVSQWLGADRGQ